MEAEVGLGSFQQVGGLLRAGVYVLLYRREVVYVGKSTLLLTRLYQHRNNYQRVNRGRRGGPLMAGAKAILFDDIRVFPCAREDLDRIEREMIAKFRPEHNTQLVPKIKHELRLKVNGVDLVLNGAAAKPASGPRFERRI